MTDPRIELLRNAFVRSSAFEVEVHEGALRLERRRPAPTRGVLRLFVFPRVSTRVRLTEGAPTSTTLPDGFAWFMSFVCAGGIAVELFSDRVRYPRTYPPEFVFAISAVFFTSLLVEWIRTRQAVRRVLVG